MCIFRASERKQHGRFKSLEIPNQTFMTVTEQTTQTAAEEQATRGMKSAPGLIFSIFTLRQIHPSCGRNVFFSEQREEKGKEKKVGGGKGGVAPISPHVGNSSHINLTPNFHTCSSVCWKSTNSLSHTPSHALTAEWDWEYPPSGRRTRTSQAKTRKVCGHVGHIYTPLLHLSHPNLLHSPICHHLD